MSPFRPRECLTSAHRSSCVCLDHRRERATIACPCARARERPARPAGLYALEHHVSRLADDHALARRFAHGIEALPGVVLAQPRVDSNIVQFCVDENGIPARALAERLLERGIRLGKLPPNVLRVVTHLDVKSEDIDVALAVLRAQLAPQPAASRRRAREAARPDAA